MPPWDRALHAHALESIGIHAGLLTPGLQADIAGFFGLNHCKRLTVITPQHVVCTALAGDVTGEVDVHFLADLRRIADIPAGLQKHGIDQQCAGFGFAPLQAVSNLLALLLTLLLVWLGGRRDPPESV